MPPLEESNMSCQPPDLPHRSMSWHGSVGNENDDFAYDDGFHHHGSVGNENDFAYDDGFYHLGSVGNENEDFAYDDGPSRPLCEDPGFTGDLLETPRKIVILMPFGFEVKLTIDRRLQML